MTIKKLYLAIQVIMNILNTIAKTNQVDSRVNWENYITQIGLDFPKKFELSFVNKMQEKQIIKIDHLVKLRI